MTNYFSPPRTSPRTAVLLLNLGTPAAPDVASVRRYLAEFLADPRVVERPRWLWWPILHGIVLRVRPRRSAQAYRRIWGADGSPLELHTAALARAVQARLDPSADLLVRHAMRYGEPGIGRVLRELGAAGVERVLGVPLFPQYSATTTGSALDALTHELRRWRRVPELRWIAGYHAEPDYIEALAGSVERFREAHGDAQHLLLSFHGLPERYVAAGDPYRAQCEATAQLLAQRLGLDDSRIGIAFQSRIAGEPWLAPYTDQVLREMPARGVNHVQVLCPGFAVDCLETLEEIALRDRRGFLDAGGARLDYIPALNASAAHAALIAGLVQRHSLGW
jgi:ferrochelatase